MPLRTDLAEAVAAAIDCRLADADVHRVTLYLFDTQKDLLDTYLGQLAPLCIRPRTETAAAQRFAWLRNQDTPGGPTIWNSGGPMSPEK